VTRRVDWSAIEAFINSRDSFSTKELAAIGHRHGPDLLTSMRLKGYFVEKLERIPGSFHAHLFRARTRPKASVISDVSLYGGEC
jgi:hypothetical protein